MFIVFEGIDGSGKTQLSKMFFEELNSEHFHTDCGFFKWTKEPMFSSEEADRLNDEGGEGSQYTRELSFMYDRLLHQKMLRDFENVVCDRYVWSGLAYVKKFSPGALGFLSECYVYEPLFRQPDVHIFVNTPIELCHKRRPDVSLDRLESLERAYYETLRYIKGPVIKVSAERKIEEAHETVRNIRLVLYYLDKYASGEEISEGWMENLTLTTLNLERVKEMPQWAKKESITQE